MTARDFQRQMSGASRRGIRKQNVGAKHATRALKEKDPLLWEANLSNYFWISSEKKSTLTGNNSLQVGTNSFLFWVDLFPVVTNNFF